MKINKRYKKSNFFYESFKIKKEIRNIHTDYKKCYKIDLRYRVLIYRLFKLTRVK
jgi:hypothetical protein